jgi:hypothetical protein
MVGGERLLTARRPLPGQEAAPPPQGAGHEDLLKGPTWAAEILPLVREVIRSSD